MALVDRIVAPVDCELVTRGRGLQQVTRPASVAVAIESQQQQSADDSFTVVAALGAGHGSLARPRHTDTTHLADRTREIKYTSSQKTSLLDRCQPPILCILHQQERQLQQPASSSPGIHIPDRIDRRTDRRSGSARSRKTYGIKPLHIPGRQFSRRNKVLKPEKHLQQEPRGHAVIE